MSGEQIESKLAKQDERINSIEKIVQMQISGIQKSIDELNKIAENFYTILNFIPALIDS
jgi:uncharacterized coiled-coil protein SlyX